jgi:mannosyl-glycoprotein endo-beta-N-acetylglucosaminidase
LQNFHIAQKGKIRMRFWIIYALLIGINAPLHANEQNVRTFQPVDPIQLEKKVPRGFGKVFVEAGRQNNIDPLFLAAISAHESGAWKSRAARIKNNWMGLMTGRGSKRFATPEDSIFYAAALLNRKPFKGYNSPGSIASIYCATNPMSWKKCVLQWRHQLTPSQ